MSKVFLINVGANTSDTSRARSPIFEDGRFIYVPFSYECRGADGQSEYPKQARPFIRKMQGRSTHCDPDWNNLTYGDNCANRRAAALRRVEVGDIMLFWALLWRNKGKTWQSFTGQRGWYLIGALRVSDILDQGQTPKDAKSSNRKRAAKNAHLVGGIIGESQRVFIGAKRSSRLFRRGVDLETTKRAGLLFRTVRAANGDRLGLNGRIPWYSSTRSCRMIWDLSLPEDRARARIAQKAIFQTTDFHLLRDI